MKRLTDFVTNNCQQNISDPEYRKACLLNIMLLSLLSVCILFAVTGFIHYDVCGNDAFISAVSVFIWLGLFLYYRKTQNSTTTAYLAIAVAFLTLIVYFHAVNARFYSLYWVSAFPPMVYLLLGYRKANIIVALFLAYVFLYVLLNYKSWQPEFEIYSLFNIAGATVCLIFALVFSEKSSSDAWKFLATTNARLDESINRLHNVLNSIAEAIFGADIHGNCVFCNSSCAHMLGYASEEDLLGKNMRQIIYGASEEPSELPPILNALRQGLKVTAKQEIFQRADGSCFYTEYSSYPQLENGRLTGAIITFMDITERKKHEAEIQHLSEHDALTGLKNRRCFEQNLKKYDVEENLPLSVIFGDINSLKLTNDIFGHAAGDKLIKKCSEILVSCCRKEDIITRLGGDEFVILLPNTSLENAEKIVERIRTEIKNACISAINCSISLGCDVKVSMSQDLEAILSNAENAMYKDKVLNRKSYNQDIVDTLIKNFHAKYPRERQHSYVVSELCGRLGEKLNLPADTISKLKRAAFMHDIGKITLDGGPFSSGKISRDFLIDQHAVVAYRILSLFDSTLDFAEDVYCHHEKWDGSGYPRGLKGEQIPLIARIITIAGTYEQVINSGEYPPEEAKARALERVRQGAGTKFDPELASLFISMMEEQAS